MRIFEHLVAILPQVYEYVRLAGHHEPDQPDLEARERWVKERVSRRAPYAMLVRSYFGHLPAVRALFD
jgi:hypothetical protein